jgi:hypothetical protein
LYSIREETFPKDEAFLNYINQITIKLNDKNINNEEAFCIYKGDFINFHKNNKLERDIIFSSQLQLNLFKEINELYIDGTFKVSPKNWFQLLNIFGYIKNKNIYIPRKKRKEKNYKKAKIKKKSFKNNNNSFTEEAFCIYKGDFINFHKKNKLERIIIFSSQFN